MRQCVNLAMFVFPESLGSLCVCCMCLCCLGADVDLLSESMHACVYVDFPTSSLYCMCRLW